MSAVRLKRPDRLLLLPGGEFYFRFRPSGIECVTTSSNCTKRKPDFSCAAAPPPTDRGLQEADSRALPPASLTFGLLSGRWRAPSAALPSLPSSGGVADSARQPMTHACSHILFYLFGFFFLLHHCIRFPPELAPYGATRLFP